MYFQAALAKNRKAFATFEAFPYGHKKECIKRVTDAKPDDTRQSRLETFIGCLAENKSLNWEHQRC